VITDFNDEAMRNYPISEDFGSKGWELVALADISIEISSGFASGRHNGDGFGIPHLRPMNVNREGKIDLGTVKSVSARADRQLNPGDVLFNNTNSTDLVGKTALISHREAGFFFSNHMTRIRLDDEIIPNFIAKQLHFLWMSGYLKQRCTKHINQASISPKTLALTIPILLPPAAEQKRIVEELEELLCNLDTSLTELKAAQNKIQENRLLLLKNALGGALTEDWRTANSDIEPGWGLLQRVLVDRKIHWEAKQYIQFKKKNIKPPQNWKEKIPEPKAPDKKDLPLLPQGWVWASLDMLGDITSGVAKGTKRSSETAVREVPYLRVANVQRGYLDLTEVKTIHATERDIAELALQDGDVLFNEGGDRDKLGRGWVWRNQIPECIHQNHVFRMRLYNKDMQAELISHHGNTFGKLWFEKLGKQTTNLASINKTVLRSFPVPVAPTLEQIEILKRLRAQLQGLAEQEREIELAIKHSTDQHYNFYRSAFNGQLAMQDPKDEPVSRLLERIRVRREARGNISKVHNKTKLKGAATMPKDLIDVLTEASDWVSAEDVFTRCGVIDGTPTEQIERLYNQLREHVNAGRVEVQPITDLEGRKISDQLKIILDK